MSNKTLLIHYRDSVLLKTGNWTKKIEVKRALKSEDISINLISSDYGRLIGMLLIKKKNCIRILNTLLKHFISSQKYNKMN